MTLPVAHGYPDYARQTPAQDVFYFTDTPTWTGLKTYGPFFCGAMPAIRILAQGITNNFQVAVSFTADSAGTQLLGAEALVLQAASYFNGAITSEGPWFTVTIQASAANAQCQLTVSSANRAGIDQNPYDGNVLIAQTQVALGAGASTGFDAGIVWPGSAFLLMAQNAGTWNALVEYYTLAGGLIRVMRWSSTAGQAFHDRIYLPPAVVHIFIQNSSGAASNVDVYLTGEPSLAKP